MGMNPNLLALMQKKKKKKHKRKRKDEDEEEEEEEEEQKVFDFGGVTVFIKVEEIAPVIVPV